MVRIGHFRTILATEIDSSGTAALASLTSYSVLCRSNNNFNIDSPSTQISYPKMIDRPVEDTSHSMYRMFRNFSSGLDLEDYPDGWRDGRG